MTTGDYMIPTQTVRLSPAAMRHNSRSGLPGGYPRPPPPSPTASSPATTARSRPVHRRSARRSRPALRGPPHRRHLRRHRGRSAGLPVPCDQQCPCHRTVLGPVDLRLLRGVRGDPGLDTRQEAARPQRARTGWCTQPTAQQSAIRNSFTLLSVIPWLGGLLAVVAYIVIAVTINNSPTKQGKRRAGRGHSGHQGLSSLRIPVAYRYGSSRRARRCISRILAEPAR